MLLFLTILPILSFAVICALGSIAFFRNPRNPSNISFVLGLASLAVIEAGNAMVLLSQFNNGLAHIGTRVMVAGEAAMPVAWLLFVIIFARTEPKAALIKWSPILIVSAAVSIFFIIVSGSTGFISITAPDYFSGLFSKTTPYYILGPLGKYFYVYLILMSLLNLLLIENTLHSSKGKKRWRIKYFIFGVGSIVAYFLYLSSQAVLFSSMNAQTLPLTSSVILIATVIMAFFIIRYRLLSVDIFISRYVVYNSFLILIVGMYLLMISVITYGIKYFELQLDYLITAVFIFVSVLFIVIIFFVSSIRRKAALFINRHFYKHKYEFRDKWMETIEKISPKRSTGEISKTLTELISETMAPRGVYLWLYDSLSDSYICVDPEVTAPELRRVGQGHPLRELMEAAAGPVMIDEYLKGPEAGKVQKEAIRTFTSRLSATLCTPLVAGRELVGFILQGRDCSGEAYGADDFEFLKAVSTQAAVQIKNIVLSKELTFAKEVEALNRLSSFILHDLKNLTNSLSLISQNARDNMDNPEFQRDTIKTIDNTVNRMKQVIDRLSNMPREINIRRQETDLKNFIQKNIQKILLPPDKDIVLSSECTDIPPIYIDVQAFEMILLNMVINAYDAIEEKGDININACMSGDKVHIIVADNGRGMSEDFINNSLCLPFKTTKKNGLGIGLYQCKVIVEAHGGSIAVESEVGQGTTFTIKLPFKTDSIRG